jgi:hypothetical protein
MPRFDEAFIKPLVASAIMGVACIGLHMGLTVIMPDAFATVFALLMGVAIYIAVMILMRGLRTEDLALLPLPKKMLNWLTG